MSCKTIHFLFISFVSALTKPEQRSHLSSKVAEGVDCFRSGLALPQPLELLQQTAGKNKCMETPTEHREEGSSPHGEQCSVKSCSTSCCLQTQASYSNS